MRTSEIISKIDESKKDLEFLKTGFTNLDIALDGGFMKKEFIVLGGSTGIGKSYISGQLQYNIACQGFNTAYFSLEISNEMVVSRLLGSIANIKSTQIITGKLRPEDQQKRINAKAKLLSVEDFMTFYDDMYEFDEICAEIKKNKFDFVIIDFIQNVYIKGMDEFAKLTYVSLYLQKLAKEMNCCVLVLSQLSNSVSREGNGSTLEYKGSGAIATACDLGFFVVRPDIELAPDRLDLMLRKNRRGTSGIKFEFTFTSPGGWIK